MLAIVAALKEEVSELLASGGFRVAEGHSGARYYRSEATSNVLVVESGIGGKRAQRATEHVVETFKPDLIVSAGFAGGVKPGLKTGDLRLCQTVWCVEGPPDGWTLPAASSHTLDPEAAGEGAYTAVEKVGHRTGDCLSVPQVVLSSSSKKQIGAEFPVDVIDMESFWVSQTAARHGISHLVLRSVLDPMEQSLPSFLDTVPGGGTAGTWLRGLRFALTSPLQVPGLLRLASQVRVARASLTAWLTALAAQERTS